MVDDLEQVCGVDLKSRRVRERSERRGPGTSRETWSEHGGAARNQCVPDRATVRFSRRKHQGDGSYGGEGVRDWCRDQRGGDTAKEAGGCKET